MRISTDILQTLDQNSVDVSSAWLWVDSDTYDSSYRQVLTQPVSLEAITLDFLRWKTSTVTLVIRATESDTSDVLFAGEAALIDDAQGSAQPSHNDLQNIYGEYPYYHLAESVHTLVNAIGALPGTGLLNIASSVPSLIGIGVANGVCGLGADSRVAWSNLPAALSGAVHYAGAWNASTNTPTLPDPTTNNGAYYAVSVAGTQFGITWAVGDACISNGTAYEKIDNTQAVTSVFGRVGAITAVAGDYSAYYPLLTGSYANPTWLTALAWSKLTGTPTTLSGYGISSSDTMFDGKYQPIEDQRLSTANSPHFTALTTSGSSTLAGLTLTNSLYGLTEFCNLSASSNGVYYYVGSLAPGGSGAYYHLTVKIQGGDWTQPGGVIVDFNVYGNAPKACVSGMGTFSSSFVCYANSSTGNFDFYYKPSFANWSAFGISSKLLTSGTIYDYSATQLSNSNTTSPVGTLTAIGVTTWINQAVATNSFPTFAGLYSKYATIDGQYYTTNGAYASFGHKSCTAATNFCLLQDANGTTFLNSSYAIHLQNNNRDIATIDANGINGTLNGTATNANQLGGRNDYNYVWGNGINYGVRTYQLSSFTNGTPQNGSINTLTASTFADGYFTDTTQVPQTGWWTFIRVKHSDPSGVGGAATWGTDWAAAMTPGAGNNEQYCVRANTNSAYGAWRTLIHSANYPSFNNYTSGIIAGNAGMNTWAGDESYSWCGANGFNSITWSGYMQSTAETLIGALYGGSVSLAVAQTRLVILNATSLTSSVQIIASGGISGNLTGHASLDIPLTGSTAITGSLVPATTSSIWLGTSTKTWAYGFFDRLIATTVTSGSGSSGNCGISVGSTGQYGMYLSSVSLHIASAGNIVVDNALSYLGALRVKYQEKSANYTVTDSDCGTLIAMTTTGLTMTIQASANYTAGFNVAIAGPGGGTISSNIHFTDAWYLNGAARNAGTNLGLQAQTATLRYVTGVWYVSL